MKRPKNYRPKYSLSIHYLSLILSPKELKALIDKYVKAKMNNWKEDIKGK